MKLQKTAREKLKEKLYKVNISLDIPRNKKAFNVKEFRKKAEEVRKTFKQDEGFIQINSSF